MESQSFTCPNPYCNLLFTNHNAICIHLASTACLPWGTDHVKDMLEHQDSMNFDQEFDDEFLGDHGMKFQPLSNQPYFFKNFFLSDDDHPSLHEQADEDYFEEPWSIPDPESVPFRPRSPLAPLYQDPIVDDTSSALSGGLRREFHPSPSLHIPGGRNLLQQIDVSDKYASVRAVRADIHYPFASREEWQLAKWLASAPLSRTETDRFLHLDYVSLPLRRYILMILIPSVSGSATSPIIQNCKRFTKSY